MKRFLFTLTESRPNRNGNTTRQCKLWVLKKGVPVFIGRYDYSFESEAQACYNAIETFKALPQKTLDLCMHPMGGRDHTMLDKFCIIHNLSHTTVEMRRA